MIAAAAALVAAACDGPEARLSLSGNDGQFPGTAVGGSETLTLTVVNSGKADAVVRAIGIRACRSALLFREPEARANRAAQCRQEVERARWSSPSPRR